MRNILIKKLSTRLKREAAYRLSKRMLKMKNRAAIISFCFDDFPKSALYTGGAILEGYGYSATYFISCNLCDSDSPVGRIVSKDDIQTAIKKGHEIGCHTYTHVDAWSTKPEEFEQSIMANRKAFSDIAPDTKFISFAYPLGNATPHIKKISEKYFNCARGGRQTNNRNFVDLNLLCSFFLDARTGVEFNDVKSIIDANRLQNGWLILTTHDITDHPSHYGCKTKLFTAIVDYIHKQNVLVLPIYRALDEIIKK